MITILNPEGCNPNDIKKTIVQKGDKLEKIVTEYPNGFTITMDYDTEGSFKIHASDDLIDLGNDTYQIPN